MKFPKAVMSTPELKRMGIPKAILQAVRAEQGQKIAYQMTPNGTVFWDTEKLTRFMEKHAARY